MAKPEKMSRGEYTPEQAKALVCVKDKVYCQTTKCPHWVRVVDGGKERKRDDDLSGLCDLIEPKRVW
jgi:hypothetical protein